MFYMLNNLFGSNNLFSQNKLIDSIMYLNKDLISSLHKVHKNSPRNSYSDQSTSKFNLTPKQLSNFSIASLKSSNQVKILDDGYDFSNKISDNKISPLYATQRTNKHKIDGLAFPDLKTAKNSIISLFPKDSPKSRIQNNNVRNLDLSCSPRFSFTSNMKNIQELQSDSPKMLNTESQKRLKNMEFIIEKIGSTKYSSNGDQLNKKEKIGKSPNNFKLCKIKQCKSIIDGLVPMENEPEKQIVDQYTKENNSKQVANFSRANFRIKKALQITNSNIRLAIQSASPNKEFNEYNLSPRKPNQNNIQEKLIDNTEFSKHESEVSISELEKFNRPKNSENRVSFHGTVFADDGVDFFNCDPEIFFQSFYGNDISALSPLKKKNYQKKIESNKEFMPILAECDENAGIIQPGFMKHVGTMCFTEFWSEKNKKAYTRLMKNDLQTVKIRDNQVQLRLESLYKPDKIKETLEIMNKINSHNNARKSEYMLLNKPEYKRHSLRIQPKDKSSIFETKNEYNSELTSTEQTLDLGL